MSSARKRSTAASRSKKSDEEPARESPARPARKTSVKRSSSPRSGANKALAADDGDDDGGEHEHASLDSMLSSERNVLPLDPVDAVFNKPHTISALLFAIGAIVYFAFQSAGRWGMSASKLGLVAMCLVFLLFSMLNLSNGPFIRPHPALWRVVLGISVLYLLAVTFLLFQDVESARGWMSALDSSLGKPLPERSYAEDCRIFTPEDPTSSMRNVKDALFDEFVIAHALGWAAKMLMLRSWYLAWILSVAFELLEYAFEHMLPNFGECWWDHYILDILVCNLLGMVVGHALLSYLNMKTYDWRTGVSQIPTLGGKVKRSLMQLTPYDWTQFEWGPLSSFKRFCYVAILIVVVLLNEIDAFFLKAILYVPPPHPLNSIRLFVWWLIALPAIREYYQFVTDPMCKRLGAQAWVAVAAVAVELLVCIKLGQGMFPNPPHPVVVYSWIALGLGTVGFCLYRFALPYLRGESA